MIQGPRTFIILAVLICAALASTARQWTPHSYLVVDGLPANNTSALIRDRRGFLWIGTENGLAQFDGNRFRSYTVAHGLPDNEIRDLTLTSEGDLIAWTYQHAPVRFDPQRNRFFAIAAGPGPTSASVLRLGNTRFFCDSFRLYKASGAQAFQRNLPFFPAQLRFTGRHPVLISDNGLAAALIDTATLQLTPLPLNGALARNILEDDQQNIWITTAGQGLLKLAVLPAVSYTALLPTDMAPAVVTASRGQLICGDDKGRIAVFRNGCLESMQHVSRWSRAISRIRSILPLPDGYFIAIDGDASLKLDRTFQVVTVYNRPWLNHADRCAALWRDSIVLAGGHDRALRLDLHSCIASDTVALRSTAIAADAAGRMLIGTANGLYRQDDTGLRPLATHIPSLAGRITDICVTPDGLVWIGLAGKQLVVLRNDALVATIPLDRAMPGSQVTALAAGHDGEIWAGTDKGLSRLRYALSGGRFRHSVTAFGPADGIPGQVADIAWQLDTAYVASSSGLFALPGNAQPAVREIPVYITDIRINDLDTTVADNWSVPHTLNDWTITFSGIDPAASDPVYQYRINSDDWQDVTDGQLNLRQLAPGFYHIRIRALRRDGRPSAGECSVRITIRAPFWTALWFWILAFALVLGLVVLLLQLLFRRRRARQLRRLQTEHALATSQQQTFSALMNPHFIFNALNSIQHYVLAQDKRLANRYLSGFGRLIRMNFESAQQSFIALDEELDRLRLYLELEQMRFGEKLHWEIQVEPGLNPAELQIPAMILQPFLENALMHGIAPSDRQGELLLAISRIDRRLRILIRDNGIGVANSRRLRLGNGHRSRGMELIERRLQLLQQLQGERIELRIHDADAAQQQYPGTEVELLIPVMHA